ncbi:type II secretion system F family protein [Protaetiibacter mangrovi]|uniref:Type II secretion system F family protein n=1 Tax=Protaetiibacter mangrovi TaxID=2970926 RepID=A0ABT1ZFT3_9MICO|nr:type II secretion system F family protein [Protaetiibacter mangrovi]MCS0499576.1 type II secretion system F family protein [Protaetiibacter mangrovi]
MRLRLRSTTAAPASAAGFDDVADAVHRLAILLAAGLEPLAALRALEPAPPPIAAAAACEGPMEVPGALLAAAGAGEAAGGWAYLSACWSIATEVGAPLAPALERAADTLRALADAERQVDLALSGPLATARTVALLPLAGIGMALLIGADPIGVVVGTVPGALSAALGTAVLLLGIRWNRRLAGAARVSDPLAGLGHELLALALSGGAAPDTARARVAAAARRVGVPIDLDAAEASLGFAVRAGVPIATLLGAEAARCRRLALAEVLQRAGLLGTRLLAPLALCFLPGFVLLGVVPLMIGILRDALAGF